MKVYLDNEPIDVNPPSVRGALALARTQAEGQGRLIIEVAADGSPMLGSVLDNPPDDDAGVGELRMLSAAPGPFVRETLLESVSVLDDAKANQDRAAELIQSGSVREAFGPLQRVLESWGVIRDVVAQSARLVDMSIDTVRVGEGVTGEVCINELAQRLGALRRGVAHEDWSGVADELAYEMDGLVERWRGLLAAMAEQALAGEAGG